MSIQRRQQSLLSGLLNLPSCAPMWRIDAAIDINGTEVPGCGETYLRGGDLGMAGMFGFWSRHKANLTAARAGRDELLRQRDIAIGERNELMRQRDIALGERNELMRQRDIALGERNELLDQRNKALNEREAFLRQRDVALGEAHEFRRQRDLLLIENEQLKEGKAETNEREDCR
jgi:hypothetical protein